MSADNGVYVLESPLMAEAPNGQEIHYADEYRVAHCQAIENLWDCGQYSLDFERQMFGQSPVYHDKDEAILCAARIASSLSWYTEDWPKIWRSKSLPVALQT